MRVVFAALSAVLILSSVSASAQSYAIDWFTIDGGGGTSSGGGYSVSGTIGQSEANQQPMTGGNFSLTGGFWGAVIPVQQVGAPTLLIQNLQNGNVKVSWAPNTPDFVLQEAGMLNPIPVVWSSAPVAYTNGATIPASIQTRFFRLMRP